jgi:hypothetical protein
MCVGGPALRSDFRGCAVAKNQSLARKRGLCSSEAADRACPAHNRLLHSWPVQQSLPSWRLFLTLPCPVGPLRFTDRRRSFCGCFTRPCPVEPSGWRGFCGAAEKLEALRIVSGTAAQTSLSQHIQRSPHETVAGTAYLVADMKCPWPFSMAGG